MEGPLTGLRILDLSEGIAGPYCTRMAAGFGADVVKLERPGGDPLRHWGPYASDDPTEEERREAGAFHLYLNQGKRSVELDLDADEGRVALADLLAWAEVVVESGAPGSLSRYGAAFEDLAADRPDLLYVSITPFGQSGPYRDFHAHEITTYALGGLMSMTGEPDREPLKNGGYLGQYGAGHNAFNALLTGLWERGGSGQGQHIDISIHESVASLLEYYDMRWIYAGEVQERSGNGARAAWGVYPARDGFVGVVSGPARRWAQISELTENPVLAEDRYMEPNAQGLYRDEIDALMLPWLIDHDKEDIYHRAQALGMPFGFVADAADFFQSEQLAYREFFEQIEHPVAGTLRYPTQAIRFNDGLWSLGRAPLLGEHTAEVLAEVGASGAPEPAQHSEAATVTSRGAEDDPFRREGPLAGVMVLDVSMVWAGPYGTKLLADMGATVVKVEANRQMDSVRGPAIASDLSFGIWADGEPGEDPWNRAGYFNKLNRNKLGMCMNILEDEGRAVFLELAAQADVIIENFGGGVFERMGYGERVLRELNPDLVFISMPPSGNGGPEGKYVGYGVAIEQLGGIVGKTGYIGDMPMKSAINYGDPIAGIHACGAILTGLLHRERTGRGSYLDLSQREAAICWVGEDVVEYELSGRLPERIGNRDRFMAPSGVYRCAPDEALEEDAWVALAVDGIDEWRALAETIGRAEAASDASLATFEGRRDRHDEIDAWISEWTASRTADEAMHELQRAGVAAGTVANMRRVVEDPHLQARGFWPEVDHASVGRHLVSGVSWQFGRTPGVVRWAAPQLGQHTDYALRELLGKSDDEVAALRASGVLENTPLELIDASAPRSGD